MLNVPPGPPILRYNSTHSGTQTSDTWKDSIEKAAVEKYKLSVPANPPDKNETANDQSTSSQHHTVSNSHPRPGGGPQAPHVGAHGGHVGHSSHGAPVGVGGHSLPRSGGGRPLPETRGGYPHVDWHPREGGGGLKDVPGPGPGGLPPKSRGYDRVPESRRRETYHERDPPYRGRK